MNALRSTFLRQMLQLNCAPSFNLKEAFGQTVLAIHGRRYIVDCGGFSVCQDHFSNQASLAVLSRWSMSTLQFFKLYLQAVVCHSLGCILCRGWCFAW